MDNNTGARARTAWDVIAAVLIALHAVVAIVIGGVYVAYAVVDDASRTASWLSLALLAVLIGGSLVVALRGWWRARRWARSVVMTWHVIQAGSAAAWPDLHPGIRGLAIVLAVVVIVAVLDQARRWGPDDFSR